MKKIKLKNIIFILVPSLFILMVGFFVFNRLVNEVDKSTQQAVEKEKYVKYDNPGSFAMTEKKEEEELFNEIIGTVIEVNETDDPDVLLLDVEAQIVEEENVLKTNSFSSENNANVEIEEIPLITKVFLIAVKRSTPIQNGIFDDLSEDDFLRISLKEDIYKSKGELTAINIEEL